MGEVCFTNDAEKRKFVVGGEPMLLHCHHYNVFLQRSIRDAEYIDSRPFLIGAAAEVAHTQLKTYYTEKLISDINERKKFAEHIYKWAGFGVVDFSSLTEDGGECQTHSSHFSMGWTEKFGTSDEAVCFFMSGWIVGALAAIYNQELGSYSVVETACQAMENDRDVFLIKKENANYEIYSSVGLGGISAHNVITPPENRVDYEGVFSALTNMDIVGNEDGIIPAFGVYLTRMYANYYNRISFEFLHKIQELGEEAIDIARDLFVEAGHVCAFNTFGGIMTSAEWDALVKPSLQSKEDWVHGMVAAVNALGWGRWQIKSLSEQEAIFVLHDDYESCGYLAMYGTAKFNISFLAQGACAGIMNLVYIGNVASRPNFTEEFYQHLFKTESSYKMECLSSKAMGDEVTSFRIYK